MKLFAGLLALFLSGCGFLPNDPGMSCQGSRMQCSQSNDAERFCKSAGIDKGSPTFSACMMQHMQTQAAAQSRSSTAAAINSQNLTNSGLRMMEMGQGGRPLR